MLNSPILDVALGLAFVFLLMSLMVSAVCELLSGMMKWRAEYLWSGLEGLMQSKAARDALYDHALIRGLSPTTKPGRAPGDLKAGHHGPSYIPSRTFALALMDVSRQPHQVAGSVSSRIERLLRDAAVDPSRVFAQGSVELEAVLADPAVDAALKQRIGALRDRLLLSVDPRVVEALKGRVLQVVQHVPHADRPRLASVLQWLENASAEDGYAALRRALAGAVAQIPAGGATGDIRNRLSDIVTQFTPGDPQMAIAELRGFLASSTTLTHALHNAAPALSGLVESVQPLLDDAAGDIDRFRENLEIWFNDGMDRVSGWYKRHTTLWQAGVGLVLAVLLNVDPILMARTLWRDPALRQTLAAEAQAYANDSTRSLDPNAERRFDTIRAKAASLGLPLGWRACDDQTATLATPLLWCAADGSRRWQWTTLLTIPGMILGWLITAAAMSLGSSFWFDTLKRIVSVRSSGKAPEERPLSPKDVPQPREPGQRPAEADAVRGR